MEKQILDIVLNVQKDMSEMKQDIKELQKDVSDIKEEQAEMKKDIADIKEEQAEMKKDISDIKEEQAEMKQDITSMKEEIKSLEGQVRIINLNTAKILETQVKFLEEADRRFEFTKDTFYEQHKKILDLNYKTYNKK